MTANLEFANRMLQKVVQSLDIPTSHYQLATDRYQALAEWLVRDGSNVADINPTVYSQGSFRLGTVVRPLWNADEYDLDLVIQVELSKASVTQHNVKNLVGDEIKAYAKSHQFKERAEEKRRCWRLNYADEVSFHMDILPAIPDDVSYRRLLEERSVPLDFCGSAVAITDQTHPDYARISGDWPHSNPKGFAQWFESKMLRAAEARREQLVREAAYASLEEVPAYEWKTPLQIAIQLLKRHRDVMFAKAPDVKPISMIITTLSAHAYQGETDPYEALSNIVQTIPSLVNSNKPRVPNPVDPDEDFADKWAENPQLKENFEKWIYQAQIDIKRLALPQEQNDIRKFTTDKFLVNLDSRDAASLASIATAQHPHIQVKETVAAAEPPPKPWMNYA